MNSKDEIVKVFENKGGDAHPPAIFTQTGTVAQMDVCGARWPEANDNPELMAKLALQCPKQFGFATVRVPFCITVDADTFGCEINPGTESSQPSVIGSRYRGDYEINDVPDDLISPEEFMAGRRVNVVLDAAKIIGKEENLFRVAGMNGPVACIDNLLGMENVLMAMMMEPEKIDNWLKAVTPHLTAYAEALSEVSDAVTIIEEAATDMFPPDFFDSIYTPYLPPVIKGAQKDAWAVTHTCGTTMEIADRLASLGQDGISLEVSADPQAYLDLIGGKCVTLGAINPIETLLSKTPADIVAEAKKSAEFGFDLVTPECGVPPLTPNENLDALAHYREL